jgi:putative transposase
MAGTYHNLIYHVVFSTKNREPMISPQIEEELHRYIAGILQGEGAVLLEIGGTENHVHIVARLKPMHSIPELLRRIKANSTKWINNKQKTQDRFSWQIGYGIFSVSESQLAPVVDYVANQKQHHRKRSFKEELIQLLRRHRIEYEDKYVWN